MKINSILHIFMCVCTTASLLYAHEADDRIDKEKKPYKGINIPLNKEDSIDFKEPYDLSYEDYERCQTPTNFKIIDMAMVLEYVWIDDDDLGWDNFWDQYDAQFHVVKVNYEITCANNRLTYGGTEYLISKSRIEENEYDTPRGKRMEAQEYLDWQNIPFDYLNADGTITRDVKHGDWGHYTIAKIDTSFFIDKWTSQKVKYPEYTFMGTPGKLPRPVLFIHGLNQDYAETWGVEPDGNKSGKVKSYEKGSLPYMLASSNNLYTKSKDSTIEGKTYNINNNGIYFFQAAENSKPGWDEGSSQSRALYEKINSVMKDFYKNTGEDWTSKDKYKIDLVGHSQGGLVIREMLRGLREDAGIFPIGDANAANHINKIITVNTPHLGTSLTAKGDEEIKQIENAGYTGLSNLLYNIDYPKEFKDTKLLTADVSLDPFSDFFLGVYTGMAGGFYDGLKLVNPDFESGDYKVLYAFELVGAVFAGILGSIPSAIYGSDIEVIMRGPYLGAYDFDLKFKQLFSDKTFNFNGIDLAKELRDTLGTLRKDGEHLYKNSSFIKDLNSKAPYPELPNGKKAILQPMYSESSHKILQSVFNKMAINAMRLCSEQNLGEEGCLGVTNAMNKLVKKYGTSLLDIPKDGINDNLWQAIYNIQETWLKGSDGLVEANSQKYARKDVLPDNKYFLEPRNYAIHDVLAPHEPVMHGEFLGNKGAPQQGNDLLCALSPACDLAFEVAKASGKNSVLILSKKAGNSNLRTARVAGFSESYLDVSGDFNLSPIYISKGIQGFSLSANGETIVNAKYEPGKGSSVTVKYNGTEQTETVFDARAALQPSITRKGDSISVYFTNYSGKSFRRDYVLNGLSSNLTATVIAESNAEMSPVIIGSATATNPETQKSPPPPPGHYLSPVTLAAIHREARGDHEANTSRPRILVYNTTKDTLEFSKIAYYFTADPARKPNVVVDYPHIPVSVEHLGGDQYRFVLDAGNQKIAPRSFYPSADGWQIRAHYWDWYDFEHTDDWSANYNIGWAMFNNNIVIYGDNGEIIWGNEAPGIEIEEEEEIILTPQATITWKDDSPWETNALKPRITVTNTGEVALADYHAELYFRVPQGKTLEIPAPDDWYTPESTPSVKNVGGTVWKLDLHFDKHILYPADSVSEGNIGLHLTDWSSFDKTVCGIILKDSDGNILSGTEPSVAECENYSESILIPLFTKRF